MAEAGGGRWGSAVADAWQRLVGTIGWSGGRWGLGGRSDKANRLGGDLPRWCRGCVLPAERLYCSCADVQLVATSSVRSLIGRVLMAIRPSSVRCLYNHDKEHTELLFTPALCVSRNICRMAMLAAMACERAAPPRETLSAIL